MTVVLLTGFEPFAGASVNPSWDAVEKVATEWDGGAQVVARRLPVEFDAAPLLLLSWIADLAPDVVIAAGVAEGRSEISIERIAINLDDAAIPDNAGRQPIDIEAIPGAAEAAWSTLPVKEIVAEIRAAGLPASLSLSAGTFVCNHVFYALQLALRGRRVPSGFIHVPATPEMQLGPSVPTLTVAQIAAALGIAVSVAVRSAGAP